MTESEVRRLQVENAMLSKRIHALSRDMTAERTRALTAEQKRRVAEGNHVESMVCANSKYRSVVKERDQALARKGELEQTVNAYRQRENRRKDVGLLMLLVFLCVFGCMAIMAYNGALPCWTIAVPVAAFWAVAYTSGWTV